MKYVFALALVAFLSGCAVQPPVVDNFIYPASNSPNMLWSH